MIEMRNSEQVNPDFYCRKELKHYVVFDQAAGHKKAFTIDINGK